MREQKYANVLDEYEKSLEKERKSKKEEKLSMTRELKYRELCQNRASLYARYQRGPE